MDRHSGTIPGVTPRSMAASVFCMVLLGMIAQFTEVTELMTGNWISHHPISLSAILLITGVILLSTLVWSAGRVQLFTRQEMLCIFFSMIVAAPLISQGFWQRIITTTGTLPRTSDFTKMDAFSDKLWVHGPNLLRGVLVEGGPGPPVAMATKGNVAWEEVEYNVKGGRARTARMPVLTNGSADGFSTLRLTLPISADGETFLQLKEPYLLSALMRAKDLGADTEYFCRIYYDSAENFSDEAFASRAGEKITYLQQRGFSRLGKYALEFPLVVEDHVVLEFGLKGEGRLELTDPKLMSVGSLQRAYTGCRLVTRSEYEAIPPKERAGLIVKPDNMWSPAGLKFVLSGYIPVREWVPPFTAYVGFVFCLLMATFSLNVIMRRQWVDNERYPLPIAKIPQVLLGEDADDPPHPLTAVWRNRLMWIGYGLTLFWCMMRLWHAYNPKVPDMEVNLMLKPYFADPGWGNMWNGVSFRIVAAFVALAVFMELNILASLIVGYFLYRVQFWFGKSSGLDIYPEFPFGLYQEVAGFAAYALMVVFFTRKYLWRVLKAGILGDREASAGECISYRAALLILVGVGGSLIAWARWTGMSVAGLLAFFGFMLLIGFLCAKYRAECGTPFSHYGPIRPFLFLSLIGGMYALGADAIAFSVIMSFILSQTVFFVLPGIQMELMELGRKYRLVPRHVLYIFLIGFAGGMLVGAWVFLSTAYSVGGENITNQWAFADKGWLFRHYNVELTEANQALAAATDGTADVADKPISPYMGAMLFAATATVVISILRQMFAGFWFHPFGFILGPCHMAQIVWGSCLVALVVRFTVLKLGGAAAVRTKLMPFFFGVLMASVTAYVFTGLINGYLFFFHPSIERFGVLF